MLQEQHENRSKYFEALTNFASMLHPIIRRVSQHESPDQPLSEIDAVKDILPRAHQPLSGRSVAAAAGAMTHGVFSRGNVSKVDDGALVFLVEMG
jgi:hypothetical protein